MTWIQFFIAVPVAWLGVVLFHDFMAGLGEERLWGEPLADQTFAAAGPDAVPDAGPVPAPVLKRAG
jgi:hypothetical protein